MTIYRNVNWTRRNYDCTNVVFQRTPEGVAPRGFNGEIAPDGVWVKEDSIPADMDNIGAVGGIEFYGYL